VIEIKKVVSDVSKKYDVQRVAFFGSYARGEANLNSDIDLQVDKGEIKGLFQLSGFHLDIEDKLNVDVDILTTESLSDEFLTRIGKEGIILYER
jgi:hypothetical protein